MTKIITDSASNITQDEAKALGIEVLPLGITFGSDTYLDGIDISAEEFYERLAISRSLPLSSQININTFSERFRAAKEHRETLIVILLSSALSGTYSSAVTAAQEVGYGRIFIVDSKAASVMQRLLVMSALSQIDRQPEQIVESLLQLRERAELYAVIDTLEYLHKGGRLSRSSACLGTLFRIKPLITISSEGKVEVSGKALGNTLALKQLQRLVAPDEVDFDFPVLFIYSGERSNCDKAIDRLFPNKKEELRLAAVNLCPVIGVHIGKGAAGVAFIRRAKK